MHTIFLFLITIVTVFVFDMIWLGALAKQFYANQIGQLLRKSGNAIAPIWPSAVMVYVFIALGIIYFVLPKAQGSYANALIAGAVFGAVTYGIYDFTNHAILANWPLTMTIVDLIWGTVLCSVTSMVAIFFQHYLSR